MLRGNNQLLEAARNEPSGGPGWREGLTMLSQFGRSLFDAIVALEFSVEGSREDGFASATGTCAGTPGCGYSHRLSPRCRMHSQVAFRFCHQAMNLEQDIADLEARMDAVRHTGIGFSQAEILRAYAVQLHLKQIARLLRASRAETSRAVGEAQEQ